MEDSAETVIAFAEEGFLSRLCEIRIYDDRLEALPSNTRWSRRNAVTIPATAIAAAVFRRGKTLESYLTLRLADGKQFKWKWTRRTAIQGNPADVDEVHGALSRLLGTKLSVV